MTTNPYQQPSDPAKRKSAAMTDGADRAAARAMLKAIGFDDAALAKPIIGVGTTWIETMPCNINQRDLKNLQMSAQLTAKKIDKHLQVLQSKAPEPELTLQPLVKPKGF